MADKDDLSQLTDDEKAALVALLRRTIFEDRYPLSPRIGQLRDILAKLDGPKTGAFTSCVIIPRPGSPQSSGGQSRR